MNQKTTDSLGHSPRRRETSTEIIRDFMTPEIKTRLPSEIWAILAANKEDIFDPNLVGEIVSFGMYDPSVHTIPNMAREGNLPVLKYLNQIGQNIHENQEEALRIAASKGHLHIVKYLVEEEKSDITLGGTFKTALDYASKNGKLNVVQYLIESGNSNLDINNAFILACRFGRLRIVKYLISVGATDLESGFRAAAIGGQIQIIDYLFELAGTALNLEIAIDKASLKGQLETVRRLIYLAAINRVNVSYNNALIHASYGGHLNVVQYLISLGADSFEESIRVANENGHFEVIEYLTDIAKEDEYS